MDFQFSEEQKMIKAAAWEFLEREIVPLAAERDRKGPLTKREAAELIRQLIPFGYYLGPLPEEYGGSWLDARTNGLLMEELSRAWSSLAGTVFIAGGLPRTLATVGSDDQRQRFLSRALAVDIIGCSAITEPNVGSDAASIETTAVLDGDYYVLNGTKTWISNGSIADVAAVVCVTEKGKGAMGISQILVEKEVSPFQVRELHKLGQRAFPTSELSFIDCRVPKQNLVGATGLGYRRTITAFDTARAMVAVMAVGIAQAALDAAIKYAQERKQFGRPIGSFQMIQEMIADMTADTEASRLLAYRALDMIDRGERCRWQSSVAKFFATERAVEVTSKAIQIHGAMGLSDEYPVERYFRDARVLTIPDGTTQIQKLVVGRELVGIRAFA